MSIKKRQAGKVKQKIQSRRAMVSNVLGTLRLEGLEPSSEMMALAERFVAGEINFGELDRAMEKLINSRKKSGRT